MKYRNYVFDVDLKFRNTLSASSKDEAIKNIKEMFSQDHSIDLEDKEIKEVRK